MKMFKTLFIAILAVCFLAGIANAETTLSWTASEGIVDGYKVYSNGVEQDVGGVTEVPIASLDIPEGTESVAFTVVAYNVIGDSDHSDSVSLGKPGVPTNLLVGSAL